MSNLALSSSQKRILTSLVDLSAGTEDTVCGRRIANEIDRNPGTVRNRMRSLRSLQLVEGVSGPNGGYRPTTDAYDALGLERLEDPEPVPVERDGTLVDGVTVREIGFSNVVNPELCRAEVALCGSVRRFERGDEVTVGPTPTAGLRVVGVVDAADVDGNTLMIRVESMAAVADRLAASSKSGRSGSD